MIDWAKVAVVVKAVVVAMIVAGAAKLVEVLSVVKDVPLV